MTPCGGFATALVLATVFLAGCVGKRDVYVVPEVRVPDHFRQSSPPASESAPAATLEPAPAPSPADEAIGSNARFVDDMLAEWWHVLGSKELDALVDQAIANNADLRVATLRIVQAKARFDQARADELPAITLPIEVRTEAPADGVGSVAPGKSLTSRHVYQGSVRGDWRIDAWGERRALAESSQLQLWRAIYQRDDTRRGTVANLVSQYVEFLSLNDRLRVARETEIVLRGMLESVAARLKGGDATITDLEQQRAAVYAVQATIPGLELQRENAINALAQTLGATPGSLSLSHRGLDSLAFPRVLPGVPANLLLRRPDVRVIETRLLAADADIDVARARVLPSIDLASQIGYGSLAFSRLLQPNNLAWNVIGNLSASIFDYGKRGNEVAFAHALHEELVETYVRVLYSAIRETEDAIATVQMNAKRLTAQDAATRAAKRAWDLSNEAYREGAIDYLTLLDTERTYHRNLDEYHRVSMERHKGLVALFSSLGGGIPKNAPAPARGGPPDDAFGTEYATRAAAHAPIQFSPHDVTDKRPFWLVELAGLQDRIGVTHVWRDLVNRFPDLMANRVVLPRMKGRVASEREERIAWYRIFIARFTTPESAAAFCEQLKAALIRCQALRSDSPTYQDAVDVQTLEAARRVEAAEARFAALGKEGAEASRVTTHSVPKARMTPSPLLTMPVEPAGRAQAELEPRQRPPPRDAPQGSMPARSQAPLAVSLPSQARPVGTAVAPPSREAVPADHTREPRVIAPVPGGPEALPSQSVAATRRFSAPVAPAERIGYAVQLATVYSEANAEAASRMWSRKGYETYLYPVVSPNGGTQYTVRTGIYPDRQAAAEHAARIRSSEQIYAVPVPVVLDEAGRPAPAATTSPR